MKIEEIKKKLEEMVPDFARKVQPIYNLLGWKWSITKKSVLHVPSVGEIENTLYKLIKGIDKDYYECSSGGLRVFYQKPSEHESGHYGLEFILGERRFYDNNKT